VVSPAIYSILILISFLFCFISDTVDKEENVDPRSPVILPIAADEADESDDTEDDEPEDMDWLDGSDVEQLSPEPGLSTNDRK